MNSFFKEEGRRKKEEGRRKKEEGKNNSMAPDLTKLEVRSQKLEVNPPLAPPPPRRGGEVGDLSRPPKIFRLKRRGFRPNYFDKCLLHFIEWRSRG
ncbi:MAG: hypothetical protein F6K25_01455 [Okeania sp. SIO2G4]|uniref:hypothetical protein n=1 Tax=unclassified Okeania TaxID=2634635 RepID=UPI0013B63941|nr:MULTISPECIES: hypothetical protein [unclassified Okeania]NEP44483.1 hypothetical protein [Okeania sp. SIO2H7]NEP71298.1 hypothetical protein [Okeania sp. SIO2G5]NEP92008.1 hypothetical protein [Okeania sp. SIO2F5]NEQ89485.1 hypothetical protein [Okeania sp. SIO2G4]